MNNILEFPEVTGLEDLERYTYRLDEPCLIHVATLHYLHKVQDPLMRLVSDRLTPEKLRRIAKWVTNNVGREDICRREKCSHDTLARVREALNLRRKKQQNG